jgi:hypothetical protein
MPITALATFDHAMIASPMPFPKRLWDDDVQGLPDRGGVRMAENALRSGIPEDDDTSPVRSDDRVGFSRENSFRESIG